MFILSINNIVDEFVVNTFIFFNKYYIIIYGNIVIV